jgi:hypothetical protein
MKSGIFMGSKYFTYEGKQVGLVRKAMGDVILVEDAWTNEVRLYLAKHGYDSLLEIVARVLSAGGHPPVTRAQAWIILKQLLKDEIPDVLQNRDADEVSSKGNLFARVGKATATAVDTVTAPVGKVVGGGASFIRKKPTEEGAEEDAGSE